MMGAIVGQVQGIMKAKIEEEKVLADDDEDSLKNDSDKDGKPKVIYANDDKLDEMVMIILGTAGEQHHVLQFNSSGDKSNEKDRHAKKTSQRPGNCRIKINQNPYLRKIDMMFVILIYADGLVEAKPLSLSSE